MYRIIVIIVSFLIISGCDTQPQYTSIDVYPANIYVSKEGGEFNVEVSGPDDWVTDNTADWISILKHNGSAIITIENNPGAERNRKISFHSGNLKSYLTIFQENSDTFSVSPHALHFTYKGGSATIDIECYEDWRITSCPEWITADITNGNSPATITLTAAQSIDPQEKTGLISFQSNNKVISIDIRQDCSPYIAVEKEVITIDGDGGHEQFLFISNTDVEITTEDSWIRLIDTGITDKMVSFEISRNLGGQRTGYIKITSVNDREYSKTVAINQGEKIDHPHIFFEEGYTMDISGNHSFRLHPVFVDMKDTSLTWSSDNPSAASVDMYGNVTVHGSGICRITAKNNFHNVSATIMLDIKILATSMKIMLDDQDMQQNPTAVRFVGEVLNISVSLTPAEAYYGDLVCISSDSEKTRIDGMRISCLSPGKVTINIESLHHNLRKGFTLIILED